LDSQSVRRTHPLRAHGGHAACRLRLAYLARTHQWVPADRIGDGYVFAHYGPAAGPLLVCLSGPPMGVARECSLSEKDAKFLGATADTEHVDERGIREIDELLGRLMAAG